MNKQEFNQMQLEFIEHIKSVRNAYYWDTDEFLTTFKLVLNDAKREAIAEHEAKQWKKYPENKPEGKTKYIVQYYDNSIDVLLYFGGKFTSYDNHVIAFRELPAPYQPTEKGEQKP